MVQTYKMYVPKVVTRLKACPTIRCITVKYFEIRRVMRRGCRQCCLADTHHCAAVVVGGVGGRSFVRWVLLSIGWLVEFLCGHTHDDGPPGCKRTGSFGELADSGRCLQPVLHQLELLAVSLVV